ncbi:MAG TPA: PspA/IM30 family protein [Ktedonobacteraceae bacterium]|jgi:phage shock protein A|nr:PspA/IM30 family protein [Ktedonobacteraceae bacterium]
MGLFDHLKFVTGMKAENALQKAEDPAEVFNYSYTKQLEQLQQLRQGLVTIVQNEKHIELLEAQVEAQQNRLQQQAQQAMQQGREDLARLALQRKEALSAQVDGYKQQLAQLQAQHQKIEQLVQQAEQRVSNFGTQKEMVEAQYQAAKASVHISEVATGISKESAEMNLAMQRAQEHVLQMQSRADAIDALLDSGALGDQGLLGGGSSTDLDHQLAQISSQHNVEAELAAMRQQIGGPSAQQGLLTESSSKGE